MKKLLLLSIALFLLILVSCRHQDEVFDSEDQQNLELLKKTTSTNISSDSVIYSNLENDGDPMPPPRK